MRARPPCFSTTRWIRGSSVATMTSASRRACCTRLRTWTTSGSPVSESSIFSGRRVDPIRAGMTATALTALFTRQCWPCASLRQADAADRIFAARRTPKPLLHERFQLGVALITPTADRVTLRRLPEAEDLGLRRAALDRDQALVA